MTEMAGPSTSDLLPEILTTESDNEKPDPHPRLEDYKARSIKTSQEERRFNLLLEQKNRRSDTFNESRGLIAEVVSSDDDAEEMEWNKIEEKKKGSRSYAKVMSSEWFIGIPEDLQKNWLLVPCPKGKRALVIATRGNTRAFNKYGGCMATFPSLLPGGYGKLGSITGTTILDCIWHHPSKTYYVLDVLSWNKQTFLECETEFRFYWLRNMIPETEGITERSDENPYPFILLHNYSCDAGTLELAGSKYPPFSDENVALDGWLFYHSHCHYTYGTTPLVGWLKPYMLPEVLNIPVHEEYAATKPEGYTNLLDHIEQQKNAPKKKKRRSKSKSNTNMEQMEVSINEEQQ